jgi:4-deoxy-L-threo-5-hexosulose-uronate ketol-isomerase
MTVTWTTRFGASPAQIGRMGTEELRAEFMIPEVFAPGEARLCYTHVDRMVVGGIVPTDAPPRHRRRQARGDRGRSSKRARGHRQSGHLGRKRPLRTGRRSASGPATSIMSGVALGRCRSPRTTRRTRRSSTSTPFPPERACRTGSSRGRSPRRSRWATPPSPTVGLFGCTSTRRSCPPASTSWGSQTRARLVWNTMAPHTHERRMEAYVYFG